MRLSFACTLLLLSRGANGWSSMFDDNHLTPSKVGKQQNSHLPRAPPNNGDVPQGVDPNADVPDYVFNVPRNEKHRDSRPQQQQQQQQTTKNPRQTNPPQEQDGDVPVIFQLFKRKSVDAAEGSNLSKLPPVQPSEPDAQVVPNLSQAIIDQGDDALPENLMKPAKLVKPSDVVKAQVADVVEDDPVVAPPVVHEETPPLPRTTPAPPQEKYSVPMNPNAWFGNPSAGATVGVRRRDGFGAPDTTDAPPVQQDSNDYLFPQNSQSVNPYHAAPQQQRRPTTTTSQKQPPVDNAYAFPNAKAWFPQDVQDQEKNRVDFEDSIPNIVEGSSSGEHIVDAVVEPHTPAVAEVPLFPEIEDQEKNGIAFEASIPNIVEGGGGEPIVDAIVEPRTPVAEVPLFPEIEDEEKNGSAFQASIPNIVEGASVSPGGAAEEVFEYVVPGQVVEPVVEDAVVIDPRPFASAPPDQPMFSNNPPVLEEDEVVEDVVEDFLAPVAEAAPTMHSDDMLAAGTDDVTLDNLMVPAKVGGTSIDEASIAAPAPTDNTANLHNAHDVMAHTPNEVPDNLMVPTKMDATLLPSVTNNDEPMMMNLPHEKDFLVAGTADDVVLDNIMPPTKMGADGSFAPTPPTVDEAAHANEMLVAGTAGAVIDDNLMAPTKILDADASSPSTEAAAPPNLPYEKDFLVAGTDDVVLDNIMAPTKIDADASTHPSPSVDEAAHADEMLVAGSGGDDVVLDNLMAPTKIDADAFPPSSATATPNLPHEKDFLVAGTDDVVLDNIMAPTKIDAAASTHPSPSVDEAAHANDMLVAGGDGIVLDNLMAPTKMGGQVDETSLVSSREDEPVTLHNGDNLVADEGVDNIIAPTKLIGRKAAFVTTPHHFMSPPPTSSVAKNDDDGSLNMILEPTHIGRQQPDPVADPILTAMDLLCLYNSAEFVEGPMQALALEDTLSQQWTLMQDRVLQITQLLGDVDDDEHEYLAHQDCLTVADFTALVQLMEQEDEDYLRKMIAHERSICISRTQVIEEALGLLFSNKDDEEEEEVAPPVVIAEETPVVAVVAEEETPAVVAETHPQTTTTEEDVEALMASINELLAEVEQEHQEVDALLSSSVHDIIKDKVENKEQQEDGTDVMSSITSALNKGVGMASSYLGQFESGDAPSDLKN